MGCAAKKPSLYSSAGLKEVKENYDPLEPLNRAIFKLNDLGDRVVVKPIAKLYKTFVPHFGQNRVSDFVFHLKEPNNFFNALLQGKFSSAFNVICRFSINTLLGFVGLVDVARQFGFNKERFNFSQTLHEWNIGSGFYIMLPIFGPSDVRSAIGRGVDYIADPFNIWTYSDNKKGPAFIRTGIENISERANLLETTDNLEKGSLDYYSAVRNAYQQYQKGLYKDTEDSLEAVNDEYEKLLKDNI